MPPAGNFQSQRSEMQAIPAQNLFHVLQVAAKPAWPTQQDDNLGGLKMQASAL